MAKKKFDIDGFISDYKEQSSEPNLDSVMADFDKSLKKKDDSEISEVSSSDSQEVEPVSTSPSDKVDFTSQINYLEGGDVTEDLGDFPVKLKTVIESSLEGISDPKERKITEDVVSTVESGYKSAGTISPPMKVLSFQEATAPIQDKYYKEIGLGYPTEEQRDAYISELQSVADGLGLELDQNANPVVDDLSMKWYSDQIESTVKKISSEYVDKEKNSYGKDLVTQIASGASNLYANTLDAMGWSLALNAIPGYSNLAEGQRYREDKLREDISRKDQAIVESIKEGDYGKAVGNTVLQFGESVPLLITLAMGNAVGYGDAALGYMAATSGTGRYNELENADMSEAAKIVNSTLYGLAEAIPEKFGTAAAMNAVMGGVKRGVKKEVAQNIVKQGYSSQLNKGIATLMGGTNMAIRGGVDEATTTIMQNMLDGKDAYEGVGDAFIVGMFSDVLISSPVLAIDSKDAAVGIARELLDKLPKNMDAGSKVDAMGVLVDKQEVEAETDNLDESLKGSVAGVKEELDSSIRLTTQPQTVKEKVNELNKAINEELSKEYPNTLSLTVLETELSKIDESIDLKGGKELKDLNKTISDLRSEREGLYKEGESEVELQKKSVREKEINSELKEALIKKQRIRNNVYDKGLGEIDSGFNNSVNKETKEEAKAFVDKLKTKQDESKVQIKEKAQVDEGVSKEIPKEDKGEGKEKVLEQPGVVSKKKPSKVAASAKLPDNVIETKSGLFELNEEQLAQRNDMVDKYGKERADELIMDFVDVNDLKKYDVDVFKRETKPKEDAEKFKSGKVRVEGKQEKVKEVSDKDLPKIDKTELQDGTQIQGKIDELSNIEKLDKKRKEAVQSAAERAARLGNISFALDDIGKKQTIEDIAGLAVDLSKAGVISVEIGITKAIDMVRDYLETKNPKAKQFIEDNREAVEKALQAKMKPTETPKSPTEPTTPKAKETAKKKPVVKERKLGKRALETSELDDKFKSDLKGRGIEYAVKSNETTQKEAAQIASVYIKDGRIGELKAVIMDTKNDILPEVRTALAVEFYKQARIAEANAETKSEKDAYLNDALDIFEMDMIEGTMQGRAVQSKTLWSEVVSSDPELFVQSVKRNQVEKNKKGLKPREGDIKTSKEILEEYVNSPEFQKLIEEKAKKKMSDLIAEGKSSADRIERGKSKVASGFSKLASLQGTKKNAVDETDINDDVLSALVEIADGFLDIGVGSIKNLMTKLKVATRQYVSPIDIDKLESKIIKESNASNRLQRKPKKRDILTDKELDKLVNGLYARMVGSTKKQLKTLVRDYIDRLVEGRAMDDNAFRALFAKSLGMEYLDEANEAKLRDMATRLTDVRTVGDNLKNMFDKLSVLTTDKKLAEKKGIDSKEINKRIKKLKEEIATQVKAYNKSHESARKANSELSDFYADPKTTGDLLATFVQGKLLTLRSLITNVVANLTWQPVRGTKYLIASMIDMSLSQVGKARNALIEKTDNPFIKRQLALLPSAKRTYDLMGSGRGYVVGFGDGFIEGLLQSIKGQSSEDVKIREMSQALHPIKAAIENYMMLSGKERLKLSKFINNALESALGVDAEIMFRLLNLGDKPFRRAAEKARLSEIAKLKGLEGDARDRFMMFPDEESIEDARKAGLEATYQQDNWLSDIVLNKVQKQGKKDVKESVTKMDRVIQGWKRYGTKLVIPYVKTPTNIMFETLDYAIPAVSITKGFYHMSMAIKLDSDSHKRKAIDSFSRAIVGSMLNSAIFSLVTSGVLSLAPGIGEEEDRNITNVKESEYRNKNPYLLNLTALGRLLSEENPEWQKGDRLYSYKRFGLISSIMMAKAEATRGKTQEEMLDMTELEKSLSSVLPVFRSSLDQSFLSGVNSTLYAVLKGGYEQDRWFVNLSKTISSTAIPNTYAAINKHRDVYIRDTRNKSLKGVEKNLDEIRRTFKASYTTDNGLPTKVTVWGERVNRVPDGRGMGFTLFDITDSKKYDDNFGVKIHELYERTGNKKILPSQPKVNYKFEGEDIKLTPKLYEKLQIATGSYRKIIVQPMVESVEWDNISDEEKIEDLERVYSKYSAKSRSIKRHFEDDNYDELMKLKENNEK